MIEEYKGKIPTPLLEEFEKKIKEMNVSKAKVEKILERLYKEYQEAKIVPGESIGIITAESFGEPGTQMCVHYEEKVIFKLKDRVKIIKIGEFVDKVFEKVIAREINGYEIYNVPDELLVLSLNNDEKLEWKKVLALNRVKGPKKLIKITTKSGRCITATDFHSFVTRKNNEVVSIAGKDLHIGDRIPVINYLPEHCASYIAINDYVSYPIKKNIVCGKRSITKTIPNIIKLNELFGYFVGAYLSEGNATGGQVSISNINESFILNIKKFVENIGLDYKDKFVIGQYGDSRSLIISSSILSKFVKNVCKTGSANKVVPDFCYSAKEEFVSGLLRGYFDGDGNFHISRKMIRVSSNSKELIDGIALLLARFKIFSYKTKDKKGQNWLLIPYKYAPLFLLHIGSDIEHKRVALEELSELAKKFWNDKSQDYNDMISGFENIFYDTAKKLRIRTRYVNSFTKRQKIGRSSLFRWIKKFESISKEKNININDELNTMRKMFYSDVVWDEVVNIKYIENKGYVYDLSVPSLETFTTFDGIITHNTLNRFHFAGVAELNVSQGLPRLIEIFDARKEATTPIMEVYLKKEYGQNINQVRKIAASIKEIKFGEIVDEFSIDVTNMKLEASLNKGNMRNLNINNELLVKALNESLKNVNVRSLKSGNISLTSKEKDLELKNLYQLKEKAKNCFIKGIPGIRQVLPIKQGNEFVIFTTGSELKDVLNMKEVDETRTITNDINEVSDVLGIDAAREVIIKEAGKVIKDQGLDVNIRHIMLIADLMTVGGKVRGITRSGITSEKESVFARASFETPIKHLINASLIGEEDYLNSVIENVIINQPVPLGTGLPGLVASMRKKNE